MGYDLINSAGASHQWRAMGWWNLLNLAVEYGWRPRGTRIRSGDTPSWNGNYFENAGQEVSAEDAASLADAMERMLADVKREDVAKRVTRRMQMTLDDASIPGETLPLDVLTYPIAFVRQMLEQFGQSKVGNWGFDEHSNDYLRQFIDFSRKGAFRIE